MTRKIVCIILAAVLSLCVLTACGDKADSGTPVNNNMLALEGTWEYSDESGTISYTFRADGTGTCSLLDYELPFTFTANETSLQIVTDYITLYEGLNGMSFDELVENGYVREDLRYITENYSYTLSDDVLSITDIAYSAAISDSDLATLALTKVS